MAVPPKFSGHRLLCLSDDPKAAAATESLPPMHTFELYLDYVCPYAASRPTQT